MSPETCPNCGADVPRGARACPGCGADERTGWSERADADRLGISDSEDFDYAGFVREEFGRQRRRTVPLWVTLVACLLIATFLAWWVLR